VTSSCWPACARCGCALSCACACSRRRSPAPHLSTAHSTARCTSRRDRCASTALQTQTSTWCVFLSVSSFRIR
jgi:hypothetical protein